QEMDMTEQNIRLRLKIVGFGPIDRTRVMALRELMDRHAEECTASFFEYLACLDEDSAPVGDLVTASRARQLKQEHLKAMARGDYGVPYVEERLQLASLYASAGMDPRVFLGAYHHL